MNLLGAHMSIAGGHALAIDRATAFEMTACQIFTKNANQWNAKPIAAEAAEGFQARLADSDIAFVVAHDSYLINLGTPDDVLWEKSKNAFADELARCDQLGVRCLVTHPGAHMGSGEEAAIRKVAEGLERAVADSERAMVLLETTAGQGTTLGHRFEHLAKMLELVSPETADRIGVCLDTCHAFVAGYDLSTPEGYEATWEEFARLIGLDRLKVLHVNDAKKPLGSRVDRHEHLGKGFIGETGFRLLMNDARLQGRPLLLETQKGDDCAEDKVNMDFLRGLIAG